ncbi:oligosaccharide flippase family protein [Psychroserpens luteolus]|uniref:oligosaccharide flippase family protein n=1 Tax=Psychroserpens luteolus TaxID=2855840 RepID=UPI001E28D211|nr:oligosaccharide flippase family protein [Psychroserpens luteolus]MCD2260097.1 oligosaccharide flippase family protein [Psychroserpens luteolus]
MPKHNRDYTNILKSTSLFGAVQVFSILISIVRSKVVALWIGPAGMGIIGLLSSTLKVVGEVTRLGLDTTAVREIALSDNQDDHNQVSEVVATIRKVVWFTGLLGVVVTIILSPLLSLLAFDNYEYTIGFIWISLSLLFNQLSSGQLALLQGFRKLKLLAKANLLGNFIALLVSLPLYYFFRLDAIVPVIVLSSLAALSVSWFYSNKLSFEKVKLSNKDVYLKAKGMLGLGFMLSVRGTITLVAAYVFQLYLSHAGGVDEVGYYVAGFMIMNSYVGMVFNAMQTDYFPRLSGIVSFEDKVNSTVSQQAVIGILIIGPLVVGFLSFLPIIVKVLYSNEFLVITGFISWAILGILFKTLSWSMGYVILAKGDSKLFIKTAVFFNALMLIFNILGYYFYGLEGLGISFLVYYICHFLGMKMVTGKFYKLKLSTELVSIFIIMSFLALATFFTTYINTLLYKYILYAVLIVMSITYSYVELNKRVDLFAIINRFFNKSDD